MYTDEVLMAEVREMGWVPIPFGCPAEIRAKITTRRRDVLEGRIEVRSRSTETHREMIARRNARAEQQFLVDADETLRLKSRLIELSL